MTGVPINMEGPEPFSDEALGTIVSQMAHPIRGLLYAAMEPGVYTKAMFHPLYTELCGQPPIWDMTPQNTGHHIGKLNGTFIDVTPGPYTTSHERREGETRRIGLAAAGICLQAAAQGEVHLPALFRGPSAAGRIRLLRAVQHWEPGDPPPPGSKTEHFYALDKADLITYTTRHRNSRTIEVSPDQKDSIGRLLQPLDGLQQKNSEVIDEAGAYAQDLVRRPGNKTIRSIIAWTQDTSEQVQRASAGQRLNQINDAISAAGGEATITQVRSALEAQGINLTRGHLRILVTRTNSPFTVGYDRSRTMIISNQPLDDAPEPS